MNALPIAAHVEGETVTMQRAEFERLVEILEEAQDILSAEAVKRDLDRQKDELVPAAFVDRMLRNESPVLLWREHRGLTQDALAERAGLSLTKLAQIEQGTHETDVAALESIAAALGLSVDELSPRADKA